MPPTKRISKNKYSGVERRKYRGSLQFGGQVGTFDSVKGVPARFEFEADTRLRTQQGPIVTTGNTLRAADVNRVNRYLSKLGLVAKPQKTGYYNDEPIKPGYYNIVRKDGKPITLKDSKNIQSLTLVPWVANFGPKIKR